MAKGETAAQRFLRLRKITGTFREIEVPKDRKTSALEMAAASGIEPARLFKTLIVMADGKNAAMAIVPADKDLDRKALARAMNAKRVDLAPKEKAMALTGYQMGACSPLGQKKPLPAFLDESAAGFETIFVSGGAYGLELEIAPEELLSAVKGVRAEIA
ncbi:aminoacyl-tRNA deacylase [Tepidicaulis sp. LMO-SS28]|uniref:aminoacyl-tRNA deacylase n=1 Tax=Tepidicaulis sp. LMO-SS28 TaxID=3447455 RepID=UPI003EE0E5F9